MNEVTEKFLDGIGIDSGTIANLKDPGDDLDVKKLSDEHKEKQKEVFSNDPDVIKDLATKAKGKERSSVERKVKKVFGISNDDWNSNDLDGDYEKALLFALEEQKKKGNQSAADAQADLQDANKKIKWFEETEIPRIETEANAKVDKGIISRHLRELIGDSGELIVSESVATTVLNEELRKKGYNTELKDGTLTIKTEDGLSPQDDGKTRNLSNAEVVKSILESEKLVKQSKADPDPDKKPAIPIQKPDDQSGDKGFVHPAAKQSLEDAKKMKFSKSILGDK